jgi:hypothetical protein
MDSQNFRGKLNLSKYSTYLGDGVYAEFCPELDSLCLATLRDNYVHYIYTDENMLKQSLDTLVKYRDDFTKQYLLSHQVTPES